MKTLNQVQIRIQSQLILGAAVIAAATVISLAFQHSGNANNSSLELAQHSVAQVVIEGKRMTAEEKLAYDLAPLEVAKVEIIGKRLNVDEKLAMATADEMIARHVAQPGKS
jgi:hypothetical protein